MSALRCMLAVALFGAGACEVTGTVGGAAVAESDSSGSSSFGGDRFDTSTSSGAPDRPTGDDTDASISATVSSGESSDVDIAASSSEGDVASSSESSTSYDTDEPLVSTGAETSSSDIGELAASCCSTGEAPGCPDEDVEACVCAQDPFCCETAWDELCVNTASYGDCGDPCGALLPIAPGECCEENFLGGSGCVDPYVQDCVCASDPYCCSQEWDDVCVGYIEEYGCGYCG